MISHFAAKCASQGWLPCDGSAVSRTTYALLFAAIGTTYGPGDGSTTFTVPDLRGVFVRSFDYSLPSEKSRTQVDPDTRKLGLLQPDAFQVHGHDGTLNLKATNGPGSGNNLTFIEAWGDQRGGGVVDSAYSTVEIKGPNSGKSNAAETRPLNLAMYACISTGGQ
jgi:microcystin-dependent protein